MEKKIGKRWLMWGRTGGLAIGFTISKYNCYFELGFWYIGVEF
jgi:hypothetical protein